MRPWRLVRALRNRTRGREEFWALRDLCFEVERGDVVGLIGRNGAGKSTLLKVLSRITEPTTGRIEIHGRVGSLLEVGTGFHPELSGRENIYLNGAILGMKRREIDAKFDPIVEFAELAKFIDTPVKHFSSGMYMRLAFSVAAHLEPEILLVDEVLAVGDAAFQRKCLGKMEDVSREGRTVVFVSHNMGAISRLCRRAILLDAGSILAFGEVRDVVARYSDHVQSSSPVAVQYAPDEAPSSHGLRLLSVRLLQDGEPSQGQVDIAMPLVVRIVYETLEPGMRLYCGFWLCTTSGIDVLSTLNSRGASTTPDPLWDTPLAPGRYQAECIIPANFLNEEDYCLTITLGETPLQCHLLLRDAVSFKGYDPGVMRDNFQCAWKGVVRPQLPWRTEALAQ